MKNLKNQKGITLVALVITIIVLLILAGISLNVVVGQNGILGRATSAVDKNKLAQIKEQVNIVLAGNIEEYYENQYVTNNGATPTQNLKDFIKSKNTQTAADDISFTVGNDYKSTITQGTGENAVTYTADLDQTTVLITGNVTKSGS